MELAKEVICNVISDRIGHASYGNSEDGQGRKESLETATKEAEIFLSNGLSIAVHILLGHEHCKAKQLVNCKGCCEIEVWRIQLSTNLGEDMTGKPQMLPMFLKQAIRSQLHFSPTKSWFSNEIGGENVARNYRCVYKISTSSYFQNEKEDGINHAKKVEEHQFPTCKLDNKVLNIHVKWLKREHFPARAPKCPSKRIDGDMWVYPDMERAIFVDGECPTSIHPQLCSSNGNDETGKRILSRRQSNELLNEDIPMLLPTPMPIVFSAIVNGTNKTSVSERFPTIISEVAEIETSENKTDQKEMANNELSLDKPRKIIDKRLLDNNEKITPKTVMATNISQLIANYQREKKLSKKIERSNQLKKELLSVKGLNGDQNPVEKIQSSLKNNVVVVPKVNGECVRNKGFVRVNSPKRLSRSRQTHSPAPFGSDRKKLRVPACLLCNFEESALKGRLQPLRLVDGFKLQIAVALDSFATRHITAPVTTSFFNESSLYMGNCNVSNIVRDSKPGIQVPKRCILQSVLFNPQGSVVKIFLVNIDVADMPPLSQTFIRQRTFSTNSSSTMPLKKPPVNVNGGDILLTTSTNFNSTGNRINTEPLLQSATTGVNSTSSQPTISNGSIALKFLIHIRLVSDHRGRIFLHDDIKMLLSNKGNDLEGLVSTQTQSTTQMPQFPKYSPIK